MIIYVNIANFTNWFINQVIEIWTQVINILSEIDLIENVSIIEFLIAIIFNFLPSSEIHFLFTFDFSIPQILYLCISLAQIEIKV